MKQSLSIPELSDWLEHHCFAFYMGCRVDPHSPQVREFVDALHYYLEKDFGYVSERRAQQQKRKPHAGEK